MIRLTLESQKYNTITAFCLRITPSINQRGFRSACVTEATGKVF